MTGMFEMTGRSGKTGKTGMSGMSGKTGMSVNDWTAFGRSCSWNAWNVL